mmetsp:Transcript_12186/g.23859  ORF Transcript_12186/g.23859 Transcript_12186/m.23859 type:complete len:933 (-) Transcript_12186:167-2965(-)
MVADGASPEANHHSNDNGNNGANNITSKKFNGFNLHTLFQRRSSTGEGTATDYRQNHRDRHHSNDTHDNHDDYEHGIGMGGDVRAVISARRAAAARAAMATAASGHHGNANQNDPSRRNRNRNRDDPLRMSQLERDLYNVATGKSSGCIVAAKRRVSISSCVSAVSLPEELRDGYDGRFGEEFEDNGGWEDDYHQEKEEEGTYALDEDYEDYEIYDRNNEHEQDNWIPRTLKVGQIVPTSQIARGRQVIINGDVRTLHDQDIKSLRSSANKTNQEAIQTIIDLKMQLAHESSSKDELTMKLKQIANEKSEIERKLAEMLKEKEKLDALFNERNILKKKIQLQQQQQRQNDVNSNEYKSGERRNKRASWCAAIPNTSTSSAITTHLSSSMTTLNISRRNLTALVSELDTSTFDMDKSDKAVNEEVVAPSNRPSHRRINSGLDSSLKSFRSNRRCSSVFSGSFSALFSEAAVCPSGDGGHYNDSNNKIDSSDKLDTSQPNSFHSNNSSHSNIVFPAKLHSTATTAITTVATIATCNNNKTLDNANALTSQDIMSLMEENTKLLRNNTDLSSQNLQMKSDLELLKKVLRSVLENNDLNTTSTGDAFTDAKVMDMLYKDHEGYEAKSPVNVTMDDAVLEDLNVPSSSSHLREGRIGVRRGCTSDTPKTQKSRPQPQDRAAQDFDVKIPLVNNLAGNLATLQYNDDKSVDSEFSKEGDTVERDLMEVENKFSSFSSLVLDSTNLVPSATRNSSLPLSTLVGSFCSSDTSANDDVDDNECDNEKVEVDANFNGSEAPTDQHPRRRPRPAVTRNSSLPPSAFSSQPPSYLKSLSFRRYAPARSNSFKVCAESDGDRDISNSGNNSSNDKNNNGTTNDSNNIPSRRSSMGLCKQSSLLHHQETISSDDNMSDTSSDGEESWISNGNGVMVNIKRCSLGMK